MDENEIVEEFEEFEEEVNEDIEETSNSGSAELEDSSIERDELVDTLRELITEEVEENTSEEAFTEEESTEEVIEVDYTELLTSISEQIDTQNTLLETYIEDSHISIIDKPLSDYTVGESLLCFVVITILIKGLLKLIDKFTFKI